MPYSHAPPKLWFIYRLLTPTRFRSTMAPLQNNGKLHGTIVYSVVGRLHYGFDVFTLHLPHAPSSLSQFKFLNHGRLTDGKSINYNAQFVAPSDAKLLLQGRALPPQNPMSQFDEEEELLVYVSERTGNARLHFSSASRKDGPVLGPPKGTVRVSEHPPFFFDRPVVRNGRAYFVSVQEPPDEPIKSWCAVYASCLKSGHTIRLTPRGVVDYSPALSPSGKWVMVASYGAGEWRRNHIHELQTGLYVFRAEDGSGRRMVTEQGGWPSWADENTVYFHRRAEDGWWSIYRLNLDRPVPPERITPPFVDAFTPCASATGNWIAVATRRPETEFRHIEIFDLQSKSFIPVTASISPQIHHYNPFVSPDSLRLGFHRFRGEDAEDADTVVPFLERVESPIQKLKLQRINGSFPAFSPDGTLIAFNPNIGLPDGGVHLVKADGSKKWEMNFKGPAFAVAWNGKQKGLLYASVGPIFASLQSTVHVVSLRFKPEDLGEESQVKSEVRVLTKEGTLNNAFSYSCPDGKELVFRSGRSGHKNLYIMDAEEGEEGWIRTLTKGPWIDTMPCWSPDGQWIAFSSNRHDPQQEEYFSVYLIHPDGTGLHRVPGPQKERINHVCFSPDSKSLLFTANFSGVSAEPVSLPNQFQPYGELFVAGLDGSNLQRLTFNAYEDGTPAWHQGCSDDVLNLNSLNLSGKEIAGEKLKGQFDEPLWLAKS